MKGFFKFLFLIASLYLIGFIVLYSWALFDFEFISLDYYYYISDISSVIWGGFATICFIIVTIKMKHEAKDWRPWVFLTIGNSLWFFGEITWAFYELILLVETPYPSVGDCFWMVGYAFFLIGLIAEIRKGDLQPVKDRINTVLMYSIIIFVVIVSFIFRPIAIYPVDEEFTLLQKTASLIYPMGDIALSVASVILLYAYSKQENVKVWLWLGIGFFLTTIADFIFTLLDWEGLLTEWVWSDVFYVAGYIAFGFGCLYLLGTIAKDKPKEFSQIKASEVQR